MKFRGHRGVDGKQVNGEKGTNRRRAILRNLIPQQGIERVKEV